MKILHVIGQKPNSTGSGVYMSGLINGLQDMGHKQAVIAGIDIKDDKNCFSSDIIFFPVIYNSKSLPFPVLGMSDIMPYESTRYKDINKDMINIIKDEFKNKIEEAINLFKPDVVICNHLYLITAFVREIVNDIKIVGICHGTCLRQLKSIDLEREYILSNISKLDKIMVLHKEQKEEVLNLFNISDDKVSIVGSGYNEDIFYNKCYRRDNDGVNISFAGKICKSKGIKSLIKSLEKLNYDEDFITLNIAGAGSDLNQYNEILSITEKSRYNIKFLGRLSHIELAELFNKSDIFVLPSFYEGLPVVVLEALACGSEVIVSDINGVKEWMGDEINNSGNISYIKLPKMKSIGIPIKAELPYFEELLYRELDSRIKKIINKKEIITVNMEEKTWRGLTKRVHNMLYTID